MISAIAEYTKNDVGDCRIETFDIMLSRLGLDKRAESETPFINHLVYSLSGSVKLWENESLEVTSIPRSQPILKGY